MSKRQLFLIAGTIVLAACSPTSFAGPECAEIEDTQETICLTRSGQDGGTPGLSTESDEPE